MPERLPSAPDILAVVRDFLETKVLSATQDETQFNVRIAANLLATVERELRIGPQADAQEVERLGALVGPDGSLAERNQRLAQAIRNGETTWTDDELLDHLRRTTHDALRINNPKWLG